MPLSFPNKSRSFDATRRGVRFWGYDRALEIPVFVDRAALQRLQPNASDDETGYLAAFDVNCERIHHVASALYARRHRGFLMLAASDF